MRGKLSTAEGTQKEYSIVELTPHQKNLIYNITDLSHCTEITLEFTAFDAMNCTEDTDNITLSQFHNHLMIYILLQLALNNDVIDFNVSSEGYTNGSVNVQCVFVSGSTADGCHVIFTDTTNGQSEYFNITGSDTTMITLSTSGHYTVTVHGNIFPWSCLPPKNILVIVITPSLSPSPSSSYSKTSVIYTYDIDFC